MSDTEHLSIKLTIVTVAQAVNFNLISYVVYVDQVENRSSIKVAGNSFQYFSRLRV